MVLQHGAKHIIKKAAPTLFEQIGKSKVGKNMLKAMAPQTRMAVKTATEITPEIGQTLLKAADTSDYGLMDKTVRGVMDNQAAEEGVSIYSGKGSQLTQEYQFDNKYSEHLSKPYSPKKYNKLSPENSKGFREYGYKYAAEHPDPKTGEPSIKGHTRIADQGDEFDLKWSNRHPKTGERQLKVRNTLVEKAQSQARKNAEIIQTINSEDLDTFKFGHHRFELNLGTAMTKGIEGLGMSAREFWLEVNRRYPDLLTGNAPANIIGAQGQFKKGAGKKIHDAIHKHLENLGLTAEYMNWETAPIELRFEFMGEIDRILKQIDKQILEMTKNNPLSSPLSANPYQKSQIPELIAK